MNNLKSILVAGAAVVVLSACQSTSSDAPADLTADGYQYKGAADPLLSVPGADRAGALGDRFDLIQGRQ